jgi:hypothetical protein
VRAETIRLSEVWNVCELKQSGCLRSEMPIVTPEDGGPSTRQDGVTVVKTTVDSSAVFRLPVPHF